MEWKFVKNPARPRRNQSINRCVTSMSLLSNIIPFFGHTDQCFMLVRQLWRASYLVWQDNEKALITMVLKKNKRPVVLTSAHYSDHERMHFLLKFFKVRFTQLQRDSWEELYSLLERFDWTYLTFSKFDFSKRTKEPGLWELILLRKLLIMGVPPSKMIFDFSLIKDLHLQPDSLILPNGETSQEDLRREYVLEDNLEIAKDERQLWNLLRMKISLSIPFIELDEAEASLPLVSYYNQNMKYLKFTDDDIDCYLHACFRKVIRRFPNCEELHLNWYCDEDDDQCLQYDNLMEDIVRSRVNKFELNPREKMRGFSLLSNGCRIYLFNESKQVIQCYKARKVHFHYDCNQWSAKYYMLSQSIMALKSFKNFSFDLLEETQPIGRQLDLIDFFLAKQTSKRSWMFVAAQEFDHLFIKSEFDKSDELVKINTKDIKVITSSVYQTKQNSLHEHWGHRKDSLLDAVYRVNKFDKYVISKKTGLREINKIPIGLVVDGTEIDNDVFEELCDIVRKFPDSVSDIKIKLKNKNQLDYFLKSIRKRKSIDQLTFQSSHDVLKSKLPNMTFTMVVKNSVEH